MSEKKDVEDVSTSIGLQTTPEEFEKLESMAMEAKVDLNKYVSNLVRDKINNSKPLMFEENGVAYEMLSINLPKNIVDFYRYVAQSKGKGNKAENLIAFDLIDHLNAQIEGITPEGLKELFSLDSGLVDMANKEERLFKE